VKYGSARARAADNRVANAERLGIDEHEGDPGAFAAAVRPGMIGAALDQNVASPSIDPCPFRSRLQSR
jgi:hypothetical protein